MRLTIISALFAALAALSSCGAEAPLGNEPWRTSWSEFGQSVSQFMESAERANPESPEFPQAGRVTMNQGEVISPGTPVMRAFRGDVIFEGTFAGLETDDLMPGQPFRVMIDLPSSVPGFAVANIYPSGDARNEWRAMSEGQPVRFRGRVSGIAAMSMRGGRFMAALNMIERAQPRMSSTGQPYMYFVLLTEARPMAAETGSAPAPRDGTQ
ncbi:MAG: hypothetical protein AB7J28_02880 [Hyphomonadaceae bacterium]